MTGRETRIVTNHDTRKLAAGIFKFRKAVLSPSVVTYRHAHYSN